MARPFSIAAALAPLCLTGGVLAVALLGFSATEAEVLVAPTNAFALAGASKGAETVPAATVDDYAITPKEALALMEDDKSDVVVLDVRTEQEYGKGHLEDAVLLPYNLVDKKTAAAVIAHKDDPVIVYCQSGRRSAAAVEALVELGYTQVFDLGSIKSWPYEIVAEKADAGKAQGAGADGKQSARVVQPPLYRQAHLMEQ